MLTVLILSPYDLLFEGHAQYVTLAGEQGVFEVWPFHRPLVSRLLPGLIVVDEQPFAIRRGVVKVTYDTVTAMVEPELPDEQDVLESRW